MIEPRTIEEFVEDLRSDGRSTQHILAVAMSTRWASRLGEVMDILEKFEKRKKKRK